MLDALVAGLLTGLSLIVAIGAQNAFVLRQGLLRQYVGPVVTVCAVSDLVLITAGVAGIGAIVQHAPAALTVVRWLGVAFLTAYGVRSLWRSRHAGALATKDAARLLALGAQHPQDAAAALRRARMLREALNRVFAAGIAGRTADHADLEIVNGALAEAMAHARLEPVGNGYTWAWATDGAGLDVMLWPVVRSAADLLTSTDLERVRTCDSERCGWIFLDTSRNHSRRWCSMNDCGNRAKARRHYQRRRPTVLPTD